MQPLACRHFFTFLFEARVGACNPFAVGWVQDSFGDVNLEQWVLTNSESPNNIKEKAVLNFREASKVRKQKWDTKAKERVLEVGD